MPTSGDAKALTAKTPTIPCIRMLPLHHMLRQRVRMPPMTLKILRRLHPPTKAALRLPRSLLPTKKQELQPAVLCARLASVPLVQPAVLCARLASVPRLAAVPKTQDVRARLASVPRVRLAAVPRARLVRTRLAAVLQTWLAAVP